LRAIENYIAKKGADLEALVAMVVRGIKYWTRRLVHNSFILQIDQGGVKFADSDS